MPISIVLSFGRARGDRLATIYWIAFGLAAVALLVTYFLLRSRIGVGLTAMRDNEEGAAAIGVNITYARILCFLGTAPFLGMAGAIITLQKLRISPPASFSITDWTVLIIFNVVIGGIGSFEGPIIGTIVYFVLRQYSGRARCLASHSFGQHFVGDHPDREARVVGSRCAAS